MGLLVWANSIIEPFSMRIHPHWQFKLRTRIIHNLINDFIGIDRQYLEAVDASLWYTYRSIVYATWENQSNFFTLAVEWSLDMYRMGYYIVCVKIPYWTSNIVDIMLIEGWMGVRSELKLMLSSTRRNPWVWTLFPPFTFCLTFTLVLNACKNFFLM